MMSVLPQSVIAGLDPAIHPFFARGWMRGSSPRMTDSGFCGARNPRDTRGDEIADCGGRIAELPQYLLGVLAQHWGMPGDGGAVVVEQDGIARGAHSAEPRMLELLHHAARD